jgi:hypothetical protein
MSLREFYFRLGSDKSTTATTYAGPQKEFLYWCRSSGHCFPGHDLPGYNPETVTEDKLLLFLNENVKNRHHKKRGKKPKLIVAQEEESGEEDEDDEDEAEDEKAQNKVIGETKKIGIKSLENYVSAIVHLWKNQHAIGVRPFSLN